MIYIFQIILQIFKKKKKHLNKKMRALNKFIKLNFEETKNTLFKNEKYSQ